MMNSQHDDIMLIQAIERYLEGKMLPEEKDYFEHLRKTNAEIDQMVVEHAMFVNQIEHFATRQQIKHTLTEVHESLLQVGTISEGGNILGKAKIIQLFHRYKKVTAIAASVGGVIALVTSAIVASFSPNNTDQIQQLSQDIAAIKQNQQYQGQKLQEVDSKLPKNIVVNAGGTAFLIDAKGYLVTNAHVLQGSTNAYVTNVNHENLTAEIVYRDVKRDLAILKINDADFKSPRSLPYSFRKSDVDLGEEVYTLGYPKSDITYNKGDLSASTGFNGDTMTWQVQMSANPGNSGGPLFNKNGEIIGVISTKERQADGVTFAIKSKNIFNLMDEVKASDSTLNNVKLPTNSSLKSKDRVSQIKQVQDYIFLVKAFNKK